MRHIKRLLLILYVSNMVSAATSFSNSSSIYTLFPQGYVLGQLGIHGMCAATGRPQQYGLPDNPALITGNQRFAIGATAQFDTKLDPAWLAQIGIHRPRDQALQSVVLITPFSPITIAIGFDEKYLSEWATSMEIMTIQHPEGTGETLTMTFKSRIYSIGIVAGYKYSGLFGPRSHIGIGIGLNNNNMIESLEFSYSGSDDSRAGRLEKINDTAYSWSVGLNAKIPLSAAKFAQLGLFYDDGAIISRIFESETIPDYSSKGVGGLPPRVVAGFSIDLTRGISLLADARVLWWDKFPLASRKTQEYAATVLYSGIDRWKVSFGFYTTERLGEENELISDFEDNIKAVYLTAGIEHEFEHLSVGLSLADSHRFSGEWRKQTIVKLNTSYRL